MASRFTFLRIYYFFEKMLFAVARQIHSFPLFSFCSVLIGAPKANTSQPDVTEGGAVYLCSWSQENCTVIDFDKQGKLVWFHLSFMEPSLSLFFFLSLFPLHQTVSYDSLYAL